MDDETAGTPVPEVPDIPGEGAPPAAGGARRRAVARIGLTVTAVAALVAGVVGVRSLGRSDGSPEAALRRAQATLSDAESYRLTITSEDQSGLAALVGPGTHPPTRVADDIEVSGDDWRSRSNGGDWVDETIAVDGRLYTRWGDSYTPIEGEAWAAIPVGDPERRDDAAHLSEQLEWFAADIESIGGHEILGQDDELADAMVVSVMGPLYLAGLGDSPLGLGGAGPVPSAGDPRALAGALAALEDAEVVAPSGGGVTIRATRRPPAEIVEAVDRPVPDGQFEVVLDADDRPVSLTLTVQNDSASHTSQIDFSDWGAAIAIDAPAEGDIDPTPWLDEEALAEARAGITPIRPTVLPEGIEMQDIYPMTADEAAAIGEDCAQLDLTYGPPIDPAALDDPESFNEAMVWDGYLDVYLLPAACARQADDTPFAPGDYGSAMTRSLDDMGVLEVLVGDTVVQIDTSYEGDTLAALVTSLRPFDLDAEIARISALAEEMWNDPRGMVLGPWTMYGP